LSLGATAAWATMLGFASLSDPGVKYRLDKAVTSDGTCISKRGKISARKSWRLSPEDPHDAAYIPSLWRMQDATLPWLLGAVIGPLTLDALLHADPNVYRRLAHSRRPRHTARDSRARGCEILCLAMGGSYDP
jgi:hypothetical protein